MKRFLIVLVAMVAGVLPTSVWGLTLHLQFTDSSVFSTDATARATIEKAAADISDALTSVLTPVNQPTFYNSDVNRDQYKWDKNSSVTGGQQLKSTYGWNFTYTNSSGSTVYIPATTVASNTIEVLVRGQDLSSSTLGVGGPAGISYNASYTLTPTSSGINQSYLQTQFNQVTALQDSAAESEFLRSSGPVISTIAGTSTLDFGNGNTATAPYSVSYGPTYGTLALDTSYGSKTFSQYWHTDYATPVASGKNDLYSVALHEMLHSIGFGGSETWNSMESGTNWTGANVIAEYGTGVNVVQGAHVYSGRMGQNIYTGQMQEAVMDPTLTVGTRKYLTTLDLAFLRDLGYSTQTYDFGLAGDFNDDGMVDLADYTLWRDNLGAATEAAINYHGDGIGGITAADYTIWKSHFGESAGSLAGLASGAAVPEPAAAWLGVATVGMLFHYYRRKKR